MVVGSTQQGVGHKVKSTPWRKSRLATRNRFIGLMVINLVANRWSPAKLWEHLAG